MELYFLIVLFLVMMTALGLGFPVAFALPGSAILTIGLAAGTGLLLFGDVSAFFAQDGPVEWLSAGVMNFRAIYYDFERDTLIAIPLFIFMGIMLQRSRIAEDLLMTMAGLFGPVPGGLGISVVFVGALLAATTGIVGATVVAMGLISLPSMMRNKYSPSLASGTICAAGTLGQIIPPSIVLIILADQLGSASDQASATRQSLYKTATGEFTMPSALDVTSTSAGDMFLGAFLPGIVLVLVYFVYILVTALVRPSMAPAVPNPLGFTKKFLFKVLVSLVPPLVLIFLVLGSIIMGIATVNQAGAIGAVGATIMAGYKLYEDKKGALFPAVLALISIAAILLLINFFDLNVKNLEVTQNHVAVLLGVVASVFLVIAIAWSTWRTFIIDDTLKEVMIETSKTTSMVFIILLGAAMLTAAFRGFGGEEYVKDFLQSLPGGFWSQFIVVMAVIFVLGFFLDFIEIAVVVVPIVAPILLADPSANITAVWLGVMIGVNIQTSFLTPPFGFALFYLRGVASKAIRTIDIYRGVVPFIILQLIALVIVGTFPPLVNYLPNRFYLSSFNAPPPMNPRLQACVESYLAEVIESEEKSIDSSIKKLDSIDFTILPNKVGEKILEAQDAAYSVFDSLEAVENTKKLVKDATLAYSSIHGEVRIIQRDIRKIEKNIKRLKREVQITDNQVTKDHIEEEIKEAKTRIDVLNSLIPEEWDKIASEYQDKLKALSKVERRYRGAMDDSYSGIKEAIQVISSGSGFTSFKGSFDSLKKDLKNFDLEEKQEAIKAVSKQLSSVAGSSGVKSLLNKARKEFKKQDSDKAFNFLKDAELLLDEEIAWRKIATRENLPILKSFLNETASNIGLRGQERLPAFLVPRISRCRSVHQDISLNF
ncbi:MAG: TRAP transporter large permease subunit [Pseudomonadota bacterium]|nr:TRAP transporter large permease subunit [Pseudomonadota bacterium]